ncbi:MAG: Txe/YoeB family addiction module toxin [Paludibacter sp.]|jgi:toxin YoeB|nr:Txe/YoeB family addiction module toxin [Paludibacter sp.]
MSYIIEYSKQADKSISRYKKSNQLAYKKIVEFVKELHEHPRTGTGHPEPLTQGNDITYSRRITKKDRLIYDIYDEKIIVLIISVESHYGDK